MCLPAKFCPKYAVDIPDQAPSNATTLDWESFLWHTYFYFRMKTAKIIFLFSTKGMMSNQHLFLTNIEKKTKLRFFSLQSILSLLEQKSRDIDYCYCIWVLKSGLYTMVYLSSNYLWI